MREMTIQLPDALVERLQSVGDRLPEVVAHGLEELPPVPNQVYQYILEFLIGNPTPEAMANFEPTPAMLERVSNLLERNRMGKLSIAESSELDEYERINHLITMMKARALPYLSVQN